jgi:SNF2 family DNA or RNA helicase
MADTPTLLNYDQKSNFFWFSSTNPNVVKIRGIKRTAASSGFVWAFPCVMPDGVFSLRDFKAIFPEGKASPATVERIEYLKSVPDLIRELHVINSLEGYEFKGDPPMMHQLRYLEYLMHYPVLAALAEQGLGKTFISLHYLAIKKHLLGRRFPAMVLAPRIVLPNWVEQTAKYSDLKIVRYSGEMEERAELRQRIREGAEWDLIVTNYECITPIPSRAREYLSINKGDVTAGDWVQLKDSDVFFEVLDVQGQGRKREFKVEGKPLIILSPQIKSARRRLINDKAYRDDFEFFTKELSFDALIMDEGSRIKGHDSKRSLAVQHIAERCPNRIILSGTISLGTPLDVYMPFTILNNNIFGDNFFSFRKRYCDFSPYNKHSIIGFKNLDVLKSHIDPYIVSCTKDECLDLPERILDYRYYELSPEQRHLYNEVVNNDYVVVGGRQVPVHLSVIKINKLLQLLSGFIFLPLVRDDSVCNECTHLMDCLQDRVYPWGKDCAYYGTPLVSHIKKPKREFYTLQANPKLDLLRDMLELLEGKVIIWAFYQPEIAHIKGMLEAAGIRYITPDTPECDRVFEGDPGITVFLGQISQGIGITLNSATTTIYYSQSLKLDDRLQSMERNYRIGQTKGTLLFDLICPETLEVGIINLLRNKEDVKNLIQKRVECSICERSIHCLERGIIPFSDKCLLFAERENAESRKSIKVNKIREKYSDEE